MPSYSAADNHRSITLGKRSEIIFRKQSQLRRYHAPYAWNCNNTSVKVSRKYKIGPKCSIVIKKIRIMRYQNVVFIFIRITESVI